MKPIEITNNWLEKVWVREDRSAIDEILIPDTIDDENGLVGNVGTEAFKSFHSCLLALITNIRFDIERQNEEPDGWVSTLFLLKAERRDTGTVVQTTGHFYCQIINGRIVQCRSHLDFFRLFRQLDLVPRNAFGNCLLGKKLAWQS